MDRWKLILIILCLITATVWTGVVKAAGDNSLHIVACNVGQGDAILIFQGSNQILIDGGPTNAVVDCLGKYMPFWDRQIELVVLTHPQKDHYGGLQQVFESYGVDNFVRPEAETSNQGYQVLEKTVGGSSTKTLYADDTTTMRLGLIELDVLNPPASKKYDNVNDYSVVIELKYKEFEAIFTGDIEQAISDRLVDERKIKPVEYIKVQHHGSRNGITEKFLNAASPQIAVISVGKNSYGHPSKEVLEMLKERNIQILRTDEIGNVETIIR